MRGKDERSGELFSYIDLEARVRKDHPPRAIRKIVNAALVEMERDLALYMPRLGRPSIAPEKLLRAMLLIGPDAAVGGRPAESGRVKNKAD